MKTIGDDTDYAKAVLCGLELRSYYSANYFYFQYGGNAHGPFSDKYQAALLYLELIRMYPDAEIKKEDDYPAGN